MDTKDKEQFKTVLILFYVLIAATVWKYTSIPVSDFQEGWTWSFCAGMYKLLAALVLFGLIPMGIVRFVFRENLTDYGLGPGIVQYTVRSFCVMAPFVAGIAIWTGFQPEYFDIYPFNEAIRPQNAHIGYGIFAINAGIYLGYYFGWEFLFRGFLQHGLAARCGVPTAILIQTMASTMLHYGHPAGEVFGSIVAGLAWGFLAVRTRSILSGFAQHALLGILLDWTLIYYSLPCV